MDKENRENNNPIWAGQNVYKPKLVTRGNIGKEILVKPHLSNLLIQSCFGSHNQEV